MKNYKIIWTIAFLLYVIYFVFLLNAISSASKGIDGYVTTVDFTSFYLIYFLLTIIVFLIAIVLLIFKQTRIIAFHLISATLVMYLILRFLPMPRHVNSRLRDTAAHDKCVVGCQIENGKMGSTPLNKL